MRNSVNFLSRSKITSHQHSFHFQLYCSCHSCLSSYDILLVCSMWPHLFLLLLGVLLCPLVQDPCHRQQCRLYQSKYICRYLLKKQLVGSILVLWDSNNTKLCTLLLTLFRVMITAGVIVMVL